MNREPKKPNCKTIRGRETNGAGYNAEILLKEKLWRYGYNVKHIIAPYDLLVNDKIRVEVKTGKRRTSISGTLFWLIPLPLMKLRYNILAVVLPQPLSEPVFLFYTKKEVKDIFKNRTAAVFSMKDKFNRISQGKKSIYEVFGNPKKQP